MYQLITKGGQGMKQYFEIADVMAREVLDSSGKPTVEVEITLDDGTVGRASVPSGMKNGRDVQIAIENVNIEVAEALLAMNALEQNYIDSLLLEIDGTDNGTRLGANALLAASIACAKAAAESAGLALYNYIGGINAKNLPEILSEGEAVSITDYPTLSAFLDAVEAARRDERVTVVTAGRYSTEDSALADIAVAVNADAVVTNSVAVCNQLRRIEEELLQNSL